MKLTQSTRKVWTESEQKMEMETVTSRSAEHQVFGPNLDSMMGQNQIMGQNQTSDPTTWVNRTPPNKNKSLLVGHVTVGGSPRLQVRFSY